MIFGDMLLYTAMIMVGISVYIVFKTIFHDESQYQAKEKLDEATSKIREANHGIVLKYSRPFFRRYIVPAVNSMKRRQKIREKYKRPLATAGLADYLSPEEFYSFKLFLILGFPAFFMFLRAFLEEDWPMSLMIILAPVGYVYPDIWIKGKIKARQSEMIRAMPFTVDMLALCVEAGLDFVAAMARVLQKAKKSPITEEFEILLKEIAVGASRAEALRNLSWRADLVNVSSFCATLIAADSVGANIGPILKALSQEIRQKRSNDVEKSAATAATKILFPMMAFIVPAVFLIIAAPLVLEFIGGK